MDEDAVWDQRSQVSYLRPEGWRLKSETELAEIAAFYKKAYTSYLTSDGPSHVAVIRVCPSRNYRDGEIPADELESFARKVATGSQGMMLADHEVESRTLLVDDHEAATATAHAYVRVEPGVPPPRWWWVRATVVKPLDETVVLITTLRAEGDVRGLDDDLTAVLDWVHDSLTVHV